MHILAWVTRVIRTHLPGLLVTVILLSLVLAIHYLMRFAVFALPLYELPVPH